MRRLWVVLVGALAACGGGSSSKATGPGPGAGTATVNGTIGGATLTPREAVSAVFASDPACAQEGVPVSVGAVVISDVAGQCAVANDPCRATPSTLGIGLAVVAGSVTRTAPGITPGSFPVNTTPTADPQGIVRAGSIEVFRTSATCTAEPGLPAVTGGNVTITAVSGSTMKGTFSASLSDGTTVTGSFDSAACAVPAEKVCGSRTCSGTPTCR